MSQTIALDLIDPSPTQPRKVFRKLEELAASIAALGVRDAIKVRTSPKAPHRFELIDGERRVRASRIAGNTSIPADVVEMEDEEVILVQLAHNDAEPLTAIEEAGAYRRLIDDFGQTVEEIALNAGVAKSIVWARLRLTFLVPALRALLDEDRISQSAAQLIALEPDDVQELIADDAAALFPLPSMKLTRDDVRNLLDRHVRRLDAAPFDRTLTTFVDSTTGAALPSCEVCPQNTAAQRSLLPDEVEEALCMRKACWDAKIGAAWEARAADAEKTHLRVLTAEEAALALDGARVRPGAPWVNVDEPIAVEDPRTWRELEKELAEADANGEGYAIERCALARSGEHFLVLLDAPYAAEYVAASYPDRARELRGEPAPGVVADKAKQQATKEEKAKLAELHAFACTRLIDAMAQDGPDDRERRHKLMRLLPIIAADMGGAGVTAAVAKRRALALEEPDGRKLSGREALIRFASDAELGALTGLLVELLVLAALSDERMPETQVHGVLSLYELSLPALRKELARGKRNVKARKKGKSGDEERGAEGEAAE